MSDEQQQSAGPERLPIWYPESFSRKTLHGTEIWWTVVNRDTGESCRHAWLNIGAALEKSEALNAEDNNPVDPTARQ